MHGVLICVAHRRGGEEKHGGERCDVQGRKKNGGAGADASV